MGRYVVKKLLGILALVMIASLSVCGCTTTTNNNAATSPPTTHDALLEKLVNATKEEVYGNASYAVQARGRDVEQRHERYRPWNGRRDVYGNNGCSKQLVHVIPHNAGRHELS